MKKIPVLFLAFILILTLIPQSVSASSTSDPIRKKVTIKGENFGGEATLTLSYDPKWLTVLPAENCYPELAKFACILSAGAYGKATIDTQGAAGIDALLKSFGFDNIEHTKAIDPDGYDPDGPEDPDDYIDPYDVAGLIMASRQDVVDNVKYTTFAIIIAGTDGSTEQWYSNLDMGDPKEFGEAFHPDWTDKNNHKGFDVAATRVYRLASEYMDKYQKSGSTRRVLYTGHSRGAAIANILGARYPGNSVAYTFATPNTTKVRRAYTNIHNIVNTNDLISNVPTGEMGYARYGKNWIFDVPSDLKVQRLITEYGGSYSEAYLADVIEELNQIWETSEDTDDMITNLVLVIMQLLSQKDAIAANHNCVTSLAMASALPEPAPPTPPTPSTPYYPTPAPAPSKGTIGDGTDGSEIKISVTISDGNATVSNILESTIDKIADTTEKSIVIDVSNSVNDGNKVSKVTIPKTTLENIATVLGSSENNKSDISIVTNTAVVTIDGKALAAITSQAKGDNIQIVVEDKGRSKLNDSQKSSIKIFNNSAGKTVVQTFEAYIVSAGERISDFKGGKILVGKIDFKIPAGKNAENYQVYYLPASGAPKLCTTWVEDRMVFFGTGHFSDYAIVYDESMENGIRKEVLKEVYRLYDPKTGEHLLTTDKNEVKKLTGEGWISEDSPGMGTDSGVEVFRLYNPATGEHLYTADKNECNVLTVERGWVYDNNGKPIIYGFTSGKPMYRIYNKSLPAIASHHYTSDTNEVRVLTTERDYISDNEGKEVFFLQ